MKINGLEITTATQRDIRGISQLQQENSAANNGSLSAALPESTIAAMIDEMPVIVARAGDKVLGFLMTSSMRKNIELPIIKAMLATYSGGNNAFLYGPICVSAEARNQGLAKKMFAELRPLVAGREGILFIRNDNAPSIKAHVNMGMKLVAEFEFSGVQHSIFSFIA
ncbi:GNAT family N-acetyltransferase [Pantoea sp.]|uniref:GNAT family N-acetyltransferase n=1 Tax=Pantoea sp. TaxID=69393 RepID=UPI0031D1B78D